MTSKSSVLCLAIVGAFALGVASSMAQTYSFVSFPNDSTHTAAVVAAAIANVPTNAGVVYDANGQTNDIQIWNYGTGVYTGAVNVSSTLQRIRNNQSVANTESDDGGFFNFYPYEFPNIPRKGNNYYMEFVVWPFLNLTNGTYYTGTNAYNVMSYPGAMRILVGLGGEVYFTGDHYGEDGPQQNAYYLVPSPSQAVGNSWTNAISGKWETATNWDFTVGAPFVAPSVGDPADLITNANTKTVTIDATTVSNNTVEVEDGDLGCMTINNLYIVGTANSINTLFLNNTGTNTPLQLLGATLTLDTNGALVVNNSAIVATYASTELIIGHAGGGSSLIISNGGTVFNGSYGFIGYTSPSNVVTVTGSGSVWSNGIDLNVGLSGAGNALTISSSGKVVNAANGYIGNNTSASGNSVLVTGSGSFWNNLSSLYVGFDGPANQLIIANGATVVDFNGEVGADSSSSFGNVAVVGSGGVWSNSNVLLVGGTGAANQLIVTNGGMVYSGGNAYAGYDSPSGNNIAVITGTGSVWNTQGTLYIGYNGAGNTLTIANGGDVVSFGNGQIGSFSNNNSMVVTGPGSVWGIGGFLAVGYNGANNTLAITNGGQVFANNIYISVVYSNPGNQITISGGGLYANSALDIRNGTLTFNGGTVTVNQLVLTNFANSVFTFDAGTLTSGGSFITNNQVFVVGDGTDSATFDLNGGVHNFANNLMITNHGTLTGCGTINGNVVVGSGGTIISTCATQIFYGTVTNNGNIVAANGTFIDFLGSVVNNGLINATNGNVRFSVPLQGNGTLLTGGTNSWINSNGGKWETSTNWSAGQPNITQPFLYITNAGSKMVTIDATTTNTPGAMTISNLYIAGTANSTNTLFLNNAGTNTPLQILGYNRYVNGLTLDSNGALVVNNSVIMATNASGNLIVGNIGGSASLTISNGGAVFTEEDYVGLEPASSNNTVVVMGTGSVWSAFGLFFGNTGAANQMIVSNGGAVDTSDGYAGYAGSSNTVLVTGTGSVWNSFALYVGALGWGNQMIISNGGAVYDTIGEVGDEGPNNAVLVTGPGSVWSNNSELYVGGNGMGYEGNQMIISNGGAVYDTIGSVGYEDDSNTVVVTGSGSVWSNSSNLIVGGGGWGNQMIISSGGAVYSLEGYVGLFNTPDGVPGYNSTVLVTGLGSVWSNSVNLYVGDYEYGGEYGSVGNQMIISNSGAVVSGGALVVSPDGDGPASVTLNGGAVTVNQLMLINGTNSVFTFDAGTLTSGGTFVTNSQVFVVGDGTDAATFQLNGGVHDLANYLEIRSNAFLTGCGTVNGNVTVDPGGTVLADCGTLTFNGIVTNNGTMRADGGSVLEAYNTVVNYGTIDAINGSTNFHGGFVNHGTVLTASSVIIGQVSKSGQDMMIQVPSVTGHTYQLEYATSIAPAIWTPTSPSQSGNGGMLTFTDIGGAANPERFYRVEVTAP